MKLKFKFLIFALVMAFALGTVLPAKAFYIEVPQILQNAITVLKASKIMAQEDATVAPEPPPASAPEEMTAPRIQNDLPQIINQPQPDNNPPPMMDQQQNQNPPMQNNQPMMNQDGQPGSQGGGDNNRYLKDVQRGAKQMDRSLKQFNTLLQTMEKKGETVNSEIKEKADKLKGMLEQAKTAQSSDELQDFDMGEANELSQDLEQYRREYTQQAQQLKNVKQQIRNAEQAIKSFEKQIVKAKTCVSDEVKTKLATLKTTITTVKNAKTWAEVEAAGLEDMGELFNDVNDARDQLEICSRWPQILKQVDKELKNLGKQVTKSKALVARLSAKGIDLSVAYDAFESGVAKMKSIREEAVAKMQSGDAQGAIDLLQDDIYGQMDDLMQNQQTIQTMSNLGSFNSQFKQGLTDAQRQINALKKKKLDTSELVAILAETKTKGAELLALIKQKDVDLDTVMSGMEDLQDLRVQFGDKVAELTGDEGEVLPGMLNQPQIKTMQMPTGLNQFMRQPQQMQQVQTNPIGESNPQPSPSPTMAPGTF